MSYSVYYQGFVTWDNAGTLVQQGKVALGQWPLQFGSWACPAVLCVLWALTAAHPTELCPGCADLSRSPGLPWTSAAISGKFVFSAFWIFPCSCLLFSMRRSCCGWTECCFWGISNSWKGACNSGYAHFKMCIYEFKMFIYEFKCIFMNLKWQTFFFFLLGCFIFGFFFPK